MIRRHLNAGLEYFDQTIINRYISEIEPNILRAICRRSAMSGPSVKLTAFSAIPAPGNGKVDSLSSTLRGAKQELMPKFEQIAKEFVAGYFHPNTCRDIW